MGAMIVAGYDQQRGGQVGRLPQRVWCRRAAWVGTRHCAPAHGGWGRRQNSKPTDPSTLPSIDKTRAHLYPGCRCMAAPSAVPWSASSGLSTAAARPTSGPRWTTASSEGAACLGTLNSA